MSVILNRSLEQYLKTTTVGVTTKPITITAWVKSFDLDNYQGIFSITNNSNEFLSSWLAGAVAGDPVAALEYATAWKRARSSNGYSKGVWTHIACVFYSSTDRRVYINGGGKIVNTDNQNVNFSLFDQILIGTYKTVTSAYFGGKIAHVSIWSTDLSDAQIVSLAGGTNPQDVELASLEAYWPLKSNGNELANSNTLVAHNDPIWDSDDNPNVSAYTGASIGWPGDRPVDYDADKYWDEESETWGSGRVTIPGAFAEYLVAVGEEGEVYFGTG